MTKCFSIFKWNRTYYFCKSNYQINNIENENLLIEFMQKLLIQHYSLPSIKNSLDLL